MESLTQLLQPNRTIKKDGIHVTNDIANKTVWDKLAIENPTHAVISAGDEAEAAAKSKDQIEHIKANLLSSDVLLDYGSGYGRVAKYILPDMPLAGYIGLDSSYNMLQLFKERYDRDEQEQQTPVLFLNADIHSIPLEKQSVDKVIVCAVFLHNHKSIVTQAMHELTKVVKPGGTVLVYSSFPRLATLMGIQGQLYQILLNLMGRPFKNGPVRYYTANEIKRLFADFADVELVPYQYALLPKTLIFLPGPLEKIYRLGLANPVNSLLEKMTPAPLQRHFASFYDVIAKR
jgi:ubiquinone/menaquinone biosynthesis C-methylase UbiE